MREGCFRTARCIRGEKAASKGLEPFGNGLADKTEAENADSRPVKTSAVQGRTPARETIFRIAASPERMLRPSESMRPMASSAVGTVNRSGTMVTVTPARVQASTSILS